MKVKEAQSLHSDAAACCIKTRRASAASERFAACVGKG